jgi:DNA-binding response OmpR family regulator
MPTMLIVEDDPAWRSLYLMEFGSHFEIFEANDGLQALSMLDRMRPDVILLDLRLPRMDGRSFLRKLKAKGVKSSVIVCTGSPPEGPALEGVAQVAAKTSNLRDVRTAVRNVVTSLGLAQSPVAVEAESPQSEWRD